jgi:hypothetical protein
MLREKAGPPAQKSGALPEERDGKNHHPQSKIARWVPLKRQQFKALLSVWRQPPLHSFNPLRIEALVSNVLRGMPDGSIFQGHKRGDSSAMQGLIMPRKRVRGLSEGTTYRFSQAKYCAMHLVVMSKREVLAKTDDERPLCENPRRL